MPSLQAVPRTGSDKKKRCFAGEHAEHSDVRAAIPERGGQKVG